MYRIAICDDDIAYTEYLEKKIKEVLGKSERSSICKYYSGEEFIDDLELEFDLVFLDMQMGCKCQYKNDQKVENKNVHFPRSIPQLVFP